MKTFKEYLVEAALKPSQEIKDLLKKVNNLKSEKIEVIRKSRLENHLSFDYIRIFSPINKREKFHNDDEISFNFNNQKEKEWFYKNLKHKDKIEEYTP